MQTKLREARKRSKQPPEIGDIVLIKDDLPRGNWRIGKITELMTSFDEQVRAAKVVLIVICAMCGKSSNQLLCFKPGKSFFGT